MARFRLLGGAIVKSGRKSGLTLVRRSVPWNVTSCRAKTVSLAASGNGLAFSRGPSATTLLVVGGNQLIRQAQVTPCRGGMHRGIELAIAATVKEQGEVRFHPLMERHALPQNDPVVTTVHKAMECTTDGGQGAL